VPAGSDCHVICVMFKMHTFYRGTALPDDRRISLLVDTSRWLSACQSLGPDAPLNQSTLPESPLPPSVSSIPDPVRYGNYFSLVTTASVEGVTHKLLKCWCRSTKIADGPWFWAGPRALRAAHSPLRFECIFKGAERKSLGTTLKHFSFSSILKELKKISSFVF
jgi:hypothetical protein